MKKGRKRKTLEQLADELLAMPEVKKLVKRLGLTKKQLKKLIRYVREDPMACTRYEEGIGGIALAHELGLEEDEWAAKDKDLRELFDTIFQKI